MHELITRAASVRGCGARAAAAMVALMLTTGVASAQPDSGRWAAPCSGLQLPALDSSAALQRILGRIKERYPGASILAVKRITLDLEGWRLGYRVKVLPVDGRIVSLVLDATTLEPPEKDHAAATHAGRECRGARS